MLGWQEIQGRVRTYGRWKRTAATEGEDRTVLVDETDDGASDLACIGTGSEVECVLPGERKGEERAVLSKKEAADRRRKDREGKSKGSLEMVVEPILLISPFFFWGTSMVAMKQLGPHTTPMFIASWRLLPAGVALLGWAAWSGRRQPDSAMAWVAVSLFALADGTCFQGFLAEGLQRTPAGLGSVIIDSQPLSVAILASIVFGERLGRMGVAGLALGVAGLLLLEIPLETLKSYLMDSGLLNADSISGMEVVDASAPDVAASSIWDSGEWWMLLAAQSMAVGTVMVRWVAKYCDPVVATGWHMILGSLPLIALAVFQDGTELTQKLSYLTSTDYALLMYVSLLGSAASYGVFFYEATVRGNLTALSSLTFLTPMFAALGGFLILGESFTPVQMLGALVTLGGVGLISGSQGADTADETNGKDSLQ